MNEIKKIDYCFPYLKWFKNIAINKIEQYLQFFNARWHINNFYCINMYF